MQETDYILRPTQEDKIRVLFLENRGKIRHFVVQYHALIDSRWKTIMRIDTCHGYAHKHTLHARDKEYVVRLPGDLNTVFTEARGFILENYLKIKENYLGSK